MPVSETSYWLIDVVTDFRIKNTQILGIRSVPISKTVMNVINTEKKTKKFENFPFFANAFLEI